TSTGSRPRWYHVSPRFVQRRRSVFPGGTRAVGRAVRRGKDGDRNPVSLIPRRGRSSRRRYVVTGGVESRRCGGDEAPGWHGLPGEVSRRWAHLTSQVNATLWRRR